jgi:hypothetical protein
MKIISHRGLWYKREERNSFDSLKLSLNTNFGLETDVRDFNGKLVISHDIADDSSILLSDFFIFCKNFHNSLPLALNIKADGLHGHLKSALQDYDINNYFLFDMSIPDFIGYVKQGLNVFMRLSEYERDYIFYDRVKGIWLDAFLSIWYDEKLIRSHLANGKAVCVVSEELHGRPFDRQWELIRNWSLHNHDNFMLCTDHPEKAKLYLV